MMKRGTIAGFIALFVAAGAWAQVESRDLDEPAAQPRQETPQQEAPRQEEAGGAEAEPAAAPEAARGELPPPRPSASGAPRQAGRNVAAFWVIVPGS